MLLLSAGHLMLEPVQVSARSQAPAEGRQTVVLGASTSGGQVVPEPVQNSGTSHTSPMVEARQLVEGGVKMGSGQWWPTASKLSAAARVPTDARLGAVLLASAGQVLFIPSQKSARSHTPADGRQSVVLALTISGGQAALLPVQNSSMSHTSPVVAARQLVEEGLKASVGQSSLTPSHDSARSQFPAAARQTAVLLASAGQ